MIDDEIIQRLVKQLHPSHLKLQDDSAKHAGHEGARSGGKHFSLTIASSMLDGKSLQEQHRMVYAALGELMEHRIHALSIRIIKESNHA